MGLINNEKTRGVNKFVSPGTIEEIFHPIRKITELISSMHPNKFVDSILRQISLEGEQLIVKKTLVLPKETKIRSVSIDLMLNPALEMMEKTNTIVSGYGVHSLSSHATIPAVDTTLAYLYRQNNESDFVEVLVLYKQFFRSMTVKSSMKLIVNVGCGFVFELSQNEFDQHFAEKE